MIISSCSTQCIDLVPNLISFSIFLQLSSSEQQCELLKSQTYDLNKQLLQHAQISDRAQHFEVQGQVTEKLHRELTASQVRFALVLNK